MSQTGNTAIAPKRGGVQSLVDKFGLTPETMSPAERRNAISGYDLRYRIEALVAGITAKKIKHIYRGDGAATAPGMMILPLIPAAKLFPMRHVRILLGYTAHEISHQLKTDFGLLKALMGDESMPARRRQQLKEFWNAIEDYRIEKIVRAQYPGFHVYIDDTRDFTARRFVERVDEGNVPAEVLSNPYRIGAVALTWVGARLNAYKTRAHEDALSRLEPDLRQWIEGWEDEMAQVLTCVEARDLAAKILEELDDMRQHEMPEPEDADGAGDGEEGSGTGNGEGSPKGSSGQQGDAEGGDPSEGGRPGKGGSESNPSEEADGGAGGSQDGSEADEDKSGNASGGDAADDGADGAQGDGTGGEEDQTSSGGSAKKGGNGKPRPRIKVREGDQEGEAQEADLEIDDLQKAINSMDGARARDASVLDGDELNRETVPDGQSDVQNVKRGQAKYAAVKLRIGSPAARAAGIMRRLLQSTARRRWQSNQEEGDLDFRRLVPILNGDADVHRQLNVRRSVNTALMLLLDNSGSMGGHPLEVCQETAVVLDLAVAGTSTNVEITGFTGSSTQPTLYRYRSFGQKGQAAAATLGNMDEVGLGGTPVAIPLLEGWRRLSAQKEPRRIIIVVSDGGAEDAKDAREAHDFLVSQGCIILGISIGPDVYMKAWCDRVYSIDTVDQLPTALTTLVQGVLR